LNLTTGDNNIDIGNKSVAAESDIIRIGKKGFKRRLSLPGFFGTPGTGSAVVINSNGKLGVTVSSERYKTAIAPMGSFSAKLAELRQSCFTSRPIRRVLCSAV
jgi:hypothetical protein